MEAISLDENDNSSQGPKSIVNSIWKVHFPLWYCTLLIMDPYSTPAK